MSIFDMEFIYGEAENENDTDVLLLVQVDYLF